MASSAAPMDVDSSTPVQNRFANLDDRKRKALVDYKKKLSEYHDVEGRLKESNNFFVFSFVINLQNSHETFFFFKCDWKNGI
jgi:hypothetical protein